MADLAHTEPEPYVPGGLVAPSPEPPTLTRRGLFGLVGAASGGLFVVTAGQSIGGPLRDLAVLAPARPGPTTSRSTRPRRWPGSRPR